MIDFQTEVGTWADAQFTRSTVSSIAEHLKDEVKELYDNPSDRMEAADCFLLLLHIAHKQGYSLEEAAREKLEICKKRKWGEPDERGVTKHVEKAPQEL